MWPFTTASCLDSCSATPPSLVSTLLDPAVLTSLLPLTALYIGVFIPAYRRLFPLLSQSQANEQGDYFLPSHAPPALHAAHAAHASRTSQGVWGMLGFGGNGGGRQRTVFAAAVALEAELAVLILVDIAGLLDTRARGLVLGVTVKGLVAVLVGVIPALELHSALKGVGWWRRAAAKRSVWWPWMLFLALFAGWICLFWSTGRFVPGSSTSATTDVGSWTLEALTKAAVSRIGVIGIASLALLSGFASVTTPWHTFGCSPACRARPVSETDIARRQAGLDAATEMRVSKQHRLRSLLRKNEMAPRSSTSSISSDSASATATTTAAGAATAAAGGGGGGALGKLLGAVRSAISSDPDQAEIKTLQLEIQGLEDMEARLQGGLTALLTRRKEAARAATPLGRWVYRPVELGFAAFCVYRVLTTVITVVLRLLFSSGSNSSAPNGSSIWSGSTSQEPEEVAATTDPITRSIALLTSHLPFVAGKIDPAAWTRTVAFLLSGVILVGSANSVVQTARLFGRLGSNFFGKRGTGVLGTVRRNLVLGLAQVGGAYVFGAALMLRGRVGATAQRLAGRGSWLGYGYGHGGYGGEGAVFEVFGDLGGEDGVFVDCWFEGWFLYGALGTMAGIWVLGVVSGRWRNGLGGAPVDDEWWEEEEWEGRGGVELGWKRS